MRDCGSAWLDGLFRARVALPQKHPTSTARTKTLLWERILCAISFGDAG